MFNEKTIRTFLKEINIGSNLKCENCPFNYQCSLAPSEDCIDSIIYFLKTELISELKPCPFCNNSSSLQLLKERNEFQIVCSINRGGCGGSSGSSLKRDVAIDLWNRRG